MHQSVFSLRVGSRKEGGGGGGGRAYPAGFDILPYFQVKFSAQEPNAVVKYPFPRAGCMIFIINNYAYIYFHNINFFSIIHEILYNTEGALPVCAISIKANTVLKMPTLALFQPMQRINVKLLKTIEFILCFNSMLTLCKSA